MNMKTQYEEIQINLVMLTTQDVITASGFEGAMDKDGFGNPNEGEGTIFGQ